MMRYTLLRTLLVSIICCASVSAAWADQAAFTELINDFSTWHSEQRGNRYLWPTFGYEARRERHTRVAEFRDRLEAIEFESLNREDQINHAVLGHLLHDRSSEYETAKLYLTVGSLHGIHRSVGSMCHAIEFDTIEQCAAALEWFEAIPGHVDDTIALLEMGIKHDIVQPLTIIEPVPAQIDAVLETDLPTLVDRFSWFLQFVDEEHQQAMWRRLHMRSIPAARQSLTRLRSFLTDEYLPQCRESIGLSDIPGGSRLYEHELITNTTTTQAPNELHEIGMEEIDRLRPLIIEAVRQTDFFTSNPDKSELDDTALLAAFRNYVHEDPQFRFEHGDELLTAWRDLCKRVDAWMPSLFRTIPRLPFGVEAMPVSGAKHSPLAGYSRGNLEEGYASIVSINTHAIDDILRFELKAMVLHEAIPGHHMEQALAIELENVPSFRIHHWNVAFGEGWAMYAESLGIEMGLYIDPYDDFGRVHSEMLRACRLAIDPAIHALGWSREQAEELLRANTVLNDRRIRNEVNRYIAWPGQATAYKIGELKIRELRKRAEDALGADFDIREFHDVVLLAGAIPLPVLERRVNEWIEAQQ